MRPRSPRRLLSAALSAVLVLLAPGHPAYQAAAQVLGAGASSGEAGAVRSVPVLAPSISAAPIPVALNAPTLSASLPGSAVLPAAAPVAVAAARPVSASRPVSVAAVASTARTGVPAALVPAAAVALEAPSPAPDAAVASARRLFDGSAASAPADETAPAVAAAARPASRLAKAVRRAVLALSLATLAFSGPVAAQTAQPGHAPAIEKQVDTLMKGSDKKAVDRLAQQILKQHQNGGNAQAKPAQGGQAAAPALQAAPVADTVEAPLPQPLSVTAATIDRQGATVGDRLHLTLTVRNTSDKPVTVVGLRASVQDALPEDLEIQQTGEDAPFALAPGETRAVVYELIPFASGDIAIEDAVAYASVAETAVFPDGIEIHIPKTVVTVKTVLTPDWKQKGPRDIVDALRKKEPHWAWLAAIPLALLTLIGVERLLAARRFYPKLDSRRLGLVAAVESEVERLEREGDSLDDASFHARVQDLVSSFMTDFAGLPRAARDAKTLAQDLKASKAYDSAQSETAADIALRSERARFSGGADAAERARQLGRLKLLIASVARRADSPAPKGKSSLPAILGLLPAAAGLQFGAPWVLLLLIPYAAYLAWSLRGRVKKTPGFSVSSSEQAPAARSLRARLAGLPRVLRQAAIGLLIVALAGPMIGVTRQKTYTPSTDTVVSIDLSGSMDEKMPGRGGSVSKLVAAEDAVRAYVEEQRRGTQNRVGMVTFSDNAYLDVKLTTDYDALIAHLQDLKTSGSTAIGKSMLAAIAHFAELNAMELDPADARVAEVQRLLKRDGLSAALSYAKAYPDLMQKILRPDRAKIVVVFTDGQSNEGIPPLEAADIAAQLGVKIYAVGIGDGSGLDEATLRGVADKTGAQYFRAGDAQRMKEVLLEISRLEKSPALVTSTIAVKDYTALLAMLAFFLLGAEVLLANTRLRTLYGLTFVLALNGIGVGGFDALPTATPGATVAVQAAATQVPPAMAEGNALYAQGRFDEALKKYAEALETNPDLAELYFNMGDAYMRLGDPVRAEASYRKFLSMSKDAARQSQAFYNIGNAALMRKDGQAALENYKEALRRDGNNQDAKWNLEVLKQSQKEQQQNQDQKQQQKKQKGKKGQKGQKGQQPGQKGDQKGDPGDQDGQPGDQDGQPGDQKGQSKGDGKPQKDMKQGADKLGDKLGEQQRQEQDAQRKGMTRKGSGVWGIAAMALPGIAFSSSGFLWAVGIGLPLIAGLIAWGVHKRLQAARKLSPGTAPKSFRGWWGRGRTLRKAALILGAVGLLGIASTDPKGGESEQKLDFGGKDVIVTVDGSYSMTYAEDGRLDRTKKELTDFIERLRGADRVGLVVFSGEARVASPISIDYGNFEFKVGRLEYESRGLKEGSNLAGAVKYAAERFETVKKIGDRQRIMIVVSDGDVPDEEIEAAIKAAREHGVTVYAIGVGDPNGTRIKIPTQDGQGTEYLVDEKTDRPAVTRLNEAPLRRLSESTGGAYFRSGAGMGIDRVLERVAQLQKGSEGDVIKSPRSIASWFLWPSLALLLLDLLLPGASMLRREGAKKPAPGPKDSSRKRSGSGMAALALVPLGAWPVLLPFALAGLAIAAFVAADVWTDGRVTRRIREFLQRRAMAVEKGVEKDLALLFDLREADEPRLAAFLARWRSAADGARAALIAEASRDEALGREMLAAAYLTGSSVETQEKTLAALATAARTRFESLEPMTRRLASLSGKLEWLAHSDARERLAALVELGRGPASAAVAPETAPAPRPSARASAKRVAAAAALVLALASSLVTADGYLKYRDASAQAAETATRIFYAEDAFVFNDAYRDERIPNEVLPILKMWHEDPSSAGPEFRRALEILRSSPDPKADNLLVAVFRHAGLLPLDDKAETVLLKTLIERDSETLWASMDALIAASAQNPRATQMLAKLVVFAAEDGGERALVNAFHVLKSPNPQLRGHAFQTLYGALAAQDATFFARLASVQARHAADPTLQVWVGVFTAQRLAAPGAETLDLEKARVLLDSVLVAGGQADSLRVQAYAAAKPGEEVEANPPFAAILLSVYGQTLESSRDSSGKVPPALASAVRYLVDKSMTEQILAAEKVLPGLHERLVKDGVALPDDTVPEEYEDDHGHGYYRPSSTQKSYRPTYDLSHIRAFAAAVADSTAGAAQDTTKTGPAARELRDRVAAYAQSALEAGAAAGVGEGGQAADLVAGELRPVLEKGVSTFAGKGFLSLLRAKGLAPAIADPSSASSLPSRLDADQLLALRGLYLELMSSGKSWDYSGKERAMSWGEKLYLVWALRQTDAAIAKHFPASAVPATGVFDEIARPGQEAVALARLFDAAEANAKDADFLLKAEQVLLARLSGPQAATADSTESAVVLRSVFEKLSALGKQGEAFKAAESALGAHPSPALVAALTAQIGASVQTLAAQGEKAFGDPFKDEMVDADLRRTSSDWRPIVDRGQLRGLQAAFEQAKAGAKTLTPEQKAALKSARETLPALLSLAERLGLPERDAARAAHARVTGILERGYRLFSGNTFLEAARQEGFAPKGTETDRDKAYKDAYSRAELVRIRDWMRKTLAEGKGWGYGYYGEDKRTDLTDKEKQYLRGAIAELDRMISPKTSGHGFALLGVALAAGVAPWLLFTALAFGALWLLHRLVTARAASAARQPRESLSEGVAARRDRIGVLAARFARSPAGGNFRSLFVGSGGTDFAEARPYQNEDYREVDWKTSAKKGDLYAKKFELEREMPLLLLIDVSKSGDFGTRGADKRSVIEDLSGVIALAAARANVRVGAILFSDRVEAVIPPRGGQKHAASIIDAVLTTQASGKGTDLRPALDMALRLSSSRAMVVAVSDLLSPRFTEEMSALSKRHDLRVVRVIDPAETKPLPDVGLLPVVDAETGVERLLDTSSSEVRSQAAAAVARREARIAEALTAARARAVTISTEGDPIESLAAHFHPKSKPSATP